MSTKTFLRTLGLIVALAGAINPALARQIGGGSTLLTPNGNPTGAASANSATNPDGSYFTVDLDPSAASYSKVQSWSFMPALAAQGYSIDNGWTINRFAIQGNLQLDIYEAVAADNAGANLRVSYQPAGTDPTGAAVHWIQLITTNYPPTQARHRMFR